MPAFAFRLDTSSFDAALKALVNKQLPYASSVALNKTANAVLDAERRTMESVFDNPTPFTLNSLRVKRATKTDPVAQVRFKDPTAGNRSAEKYLDAEVRGGDRAVKGIELLLRSRGQLDAGSYLVPGSAAKLDASGNLARSQYNQILDQLKTATRPRRGAKPVDRKTPAAGARKRRPAMGVRRYFVGAPGGGTQPRGIWARYRTSSGYGVEPILMFVREPHYTDRFPFDTVGEAIASVTFPREMQAALANAMANAK